MKSATELRIAGTLGYIGCHIFYAVFLAIRKILFTQTTTSVHAVKHETMAQFEIRQVLVNL